jgi:hypothetical protein
MSFSVEKCSGVLCFRDFGCYETRNSSTVWCITEANKIYNWDDFAPITINTQDYGKNHEYSYSKDGSHDKLVPEWNFHAWPQIGIDDYTRTVDQIILAGSEPYEINKVGWIGETGLPARTRLLDLGNKNKDVLDIVSMSWLRQEGQTRLNATSYISIPELVKRYSILIDIEGCGFSARLKYLLWSRRPLIIVDRPYTEFFFKHLIPWTHYIPVKRDLSDLIEKTKWILEHYDEALKIADHAHQFSQEHLTREACYRQWNAIIQEAR